MSSPLDFFSLSFVYVLGSFDCLRSSFHPELQVSNLRFPSSLSTRTSSGGPWLSSTAWYVFFFFFFGAMEVDGDLRPILHPEPRR